MLARRLYVCFIFFSISYQSVAQNDSLTNYFYKARDYGSEAMYNPFSYILNGGYDIYQINGFNREFLNFDYRLATENVLYNLGHANECISSVGWWKFTKTELLPLTYNTDGAQWVPNYLLHTVGGGMSFINMSEWYESHDVPYPKVFSALTIFTGQFLNEINENTEYTGYNSDPLADVYVFNLAGFILFSSPSVKRFFSEQLHMSDWSLQPALTLPGINLHNTGQYFSFKYNVPHIPKWSFFCRSGMGMMGGLSYKIDDKNSISFGAGARPYELILLDSVGRQLTVSARFTAGVFYDKNNSLLASLVYSDVEDYFLHLNIYPGILKLGRFSPGLWAIVNKDGSPIFGLTSTYFIGLGAEL
jgi:hypothetical protein